MEHLPEHRRRLPHARHERGQGPDASRNQHKDLHARTQLPNRTHDAGQYTKTASRGLPGQLRPSPQPQVALPKPSTAASNTYAAPTSDSETSTSTSPEHSSKQADSNPNYTRNYKSRICAHLPLQRHLQQFAVGASFAPMCILNAPRFDTTCASSPPIQAVATEAPHRKDADRPPFSALFS